MAHLIKSLILLEFTEKGGQFAKEVAYALFEYFHLAGYLSVELLNQAVDYLALEKAFARDATTVKQHLLCYGRALQ